MEREHRGIAEGSCRDAVLAHPKGVSRVVDDLQAMLVGNLFDGIVVAEVSVDVHGHDGAGVLVYERLNEACIHRVVVGAHVAEDRL